MKTYVYKELTEEAKKVAVTEVYDKELYGYDYFLEFCDLTEDIKNILDEKNILYAEVNWEDNYGISIHTTSARLTEEFFKQVLTEEDFDLLDELKSLSGGYLEHETDDKDLSSYSMYCEFGGDEYPLALTHLVKHLPQEEKYKYLLLELFSDNLSEEQQAYTREGIKELMEKQVSHLEELIISSLTVIKKTLTNMIKSQLDYLSSEAFFKELLEECDWFSEDFAFTMTGELYDEEDEYEEDEYEEDDEDETLLAQNCA